MNTGNLLAGAGLGAALAFILDPNTGGRRRALVRDQFVRASRKTRDGLDATARDLANRTRGITSATRSRFSADDVDDDVLRDRVRSKLGRVCSHPRAIEVDVQDRHVTLRGPILSSEVTNVLTTISNVRGVGSVANELDVHDTADRIPALQGKGNIAGPSLDLLQRNWAPATQALVAAAGLAATGAWLASRRNH
jgi:gas vesicle protein